MLKIKYLALTVMSMILVFAGTGLLQAAQGGPGTMRRGPGMGPDRGIARNFEMRQFIMGLQLTAEQREQVRNIMTENRNRILEVTRNLIQARLEMEAGSRESAERLASANVEAAMLRAQILEQIKPILTASQLERMEKRQQFRKQRLERILERIENRLGE